MMELEKHPGRSKINFDEVMDLPALVIIPGTASRNLQNDLISYRFNNKYAPRINKQSEDEGNGLK
jgi:hypothetical protein